MRAHSGSLRRQLRPSSPIATAEYHAVLSDYKAATVLRPEGNLAHGDVEWNRALPPECPVSATITGMAHLARIGVNYPDRPETQFVYPPEDYTNNLEVRVKGSRLYVYRMVTLLWTEHRLAVYDLQGRKLLADVLVAPEDIARPAVTL